MSTLFLDESSKQRLLDFLVDHDRETAAKYESKMVETDQPPATLAEQTAADLMRFLQSDHK